MTYYQASDGHIKKLGENELQHWKYIRKIGNRYFYTQEALAAYYRDQQKVANAEYAKDSFKYNMGAEKRNNQMNKEYNHNVKTLKSKKTMWISVDADGNSHSTTRAERQKILKNYQKDYKKKQRMFNFLDRTANNYLAARRVIKPIAKTAKRAVTPIDPVEKRIYKRRKKAEKFIRRYTGN